MAQSRGLLRSWWYGALIVALAAVTAIVSAGRVEAAGGNIKNVVLESSPFYPGFSGAIDGSGNPVFAAISAQGGQGELHVVHCNDPDCAGGDETDTFVDDVVGGGGGAVLALGETGEPVIAYNDLVDDGPTPGGLKLLTCGDADCAANNFVSTLAPASSAVHAMDLAMDGLGAPVVAYTSFAVLHIVRCGNAVCSAGNSDVSTVQDADYVSVRLDSNDYPLVSYYDGHLQLLHCKSATCSGSGNYNVLTLDSGPFQGGNARMRLDSAGNPVIAYRGVSPSDTLKLIHCSDPDCTTGATPTLLGTWGAIDIALELDSSGSPLVVANDTHAYPYAIRAVFCSDEDCTGPTKTVPLADDDVCCLGNHVMFSAAGLPMFTHVKLQSEPEQLRVFRCATPLCDLDTDGDSCPDTNEQLIGSMSQFAGGRRNAKNPNDYFNPSHDGLNRIDDVLMVVDQYFIDSGNPDYNPDTDRTLAGPNAWNLGPPDGEQRIDDVVNIVKQYYHDCS